MNRFASSALAVAALGSAAWAGTGDSDWLELDKEITTLSSTLAVDNHGPTAGGLIRAFWNNTGDEYFVGPPPAPDQSGMSLEDVDVWMEMSNGDYNGRISFDLYSGSAMLQEAYFQWMCGENLQFTWGQFKPFKTRSNTIAPENLFFTHRTHWGQFNDQLNPTPGAGPNGWDQGIALNGSMDAFSYFASLTNGSDGTSDEYTMNVRGEFNVGDGADFSDRQGGEGFNCVIGANWCNDGNDNPLVQGDLTSFTIDAAGNFEQFFFGAEMVSLDGESSIAFDNFLQGVSDANDNDPLSIMIGMDINDEFSVAARLMDGDDSLATETTELGLQYHCNGATWLLQWLNEDTNIVGAGSDGSVISIGGTFGSSGTAGTGSPW